MSSSPIIQDNSPNYNQTTRILTTAVLSTTFIVAALVVIHLYIRIVLRRSSPTTTSRRSSITVIHIAAQETTSENRTTGLSQSAIDSLSMFSYKKDGIEGGVVAECAICLSAVEEEEMVRTLQSFKHLFHVECIDMWLNSHSTCPVCRAGVQGEEAGDLGLLSEVGVVVEGDDELGSVVEKSAGGRIGSLGIVDIICMLLHCP